MDTNRTIKYIYLFSVVLVLFLFSGCASHQKKPDPNYFSSPKNTIFHDRNKVQKTLIQQHSEWKGTRYKLGGMDKNGIDCSGFVQVTFLKRFGIRLPRTTESQSKVGIEIDQDNLKTGDLVFFKTGLFVKHVGIYLKNRRFLHASSSNGVMISSIDNSYWSKKYWKAKRI